MFTLTSFFIISSAIIVSSICRYFAMKKILSIKIGSDSTVYTEGLFRTIDGNKTLYLGNKQNLQNLLFCWFGKNKFSHFFRCFLASFGFDVLSSIIISYIFWLILFDMGSIKDNENDIIITLFVFTLLYCSPLSFISVRLHSLGQRSSSGLLACIIFLFISLIDLNVLNFNEPTKFFLLICSICILGIFSLSLSIFFVQYSIIASLIFLLVLNNKFGIYILAIGIFLTFLISKKSFLLFFSRRLNYFSWYIDYIKQQKIDNYSCIISKVKLKNILINIFAVHGKPVYELFVSFIYLSLILIIILLSEISFFSGFIKIEFLNVFILFCIFSLIIQFLSPMQIFGESVRYVQHSYFIIVLFLGLNCNLKSLELILILSIIFTIYFSSINILDYLKLIKDKENNLGLYFDKKIQEITDFSNKVINLNYFNSKELLITPVKYASSVFCLSFVEKKYNKLKNIKTVTTNEELVFNQYLIESYHRYGVPKTSYIKELGFKAFLCDKKIYNNFYSNEKCLLKNWKCVLKDNNFIAFMLKKKGEI